MESELVFLGFRALRTWQPGDWLGPMAGRIDWIASADGYEPEGWIERWDFNRAACWNTEEMAWAAVPAIDRAEYQLYAYRLLPVFYREGDPPARRTLDEIYRLLQTPLPVETSPAGFVSLGFDVVGLDILDYGPTLGFQTSPLSTCSMCQETPVNRFCLIDRVDDAMAFAARCNRELPEPEFFYVVEVLGSQGSNMVCLD